MKKNSEKLDKLKGIINQSDGAVIAFSGGVDSTLLARVAHDELGSKALAVTVQSETYPSFQTEEAKKIAKTIGIRHRTAESNELDVPEFSRNAPDRCYHCKIELFTLLKQIAVEEDLPSVFEGSNADDTSDYRPGLKAIKELGIISPLMMAGLTKKEIRELSRSMELPTWDKPSFACLASRFPYWNSITANKLVMVDSAEIFLRETGFKQFRVRHHDTIARIELSIEDFTKITEKTVREKVTNKFKEIGYTYVTLDLEGYRTGSMNETLSKEMKSKILD